MKKFIKRNTILSKPAPILTISVNCLTRVLRACRTLSIFESFVILSSLQIFPNLEIRASLLNLMLFSVKKISRGIIDTRSNRNQVKQYFLAIFYISLKNSRYLLRVYDQVICILICTEKGKNYIYGKYTIHNHIYYLKLLFIVGRKGYSVRSNPAC